MEVLEGSVLLGLVALRGYELLSRHLASSHASVDVEVAAADTRTAPCTFTSQTTCTCGPPRLASYISYTATPPWTSRTVGRSWGLNAQGTRVKIWVNVQSGLKSREK